MRMTIGLLALATFAAAPAFAKSSNKLVVPIKTSAGQDAGTATFRQLKDGKLSVKLNLKNLPFGEHAVHIHEHAVCDAPDFKSAGKKHGTMNPDGHHNGDLPQNVSIGEDHMGSASFKVSDLSMTEGGANNILTGTAIVVHEKADDMKTDPTGNAGNRIACGVISAPTP